MEIIERLEKATGPDPKLDWLIADELGLIPEHKIIPVGWDYHWYRSSDDELTLWRAKDGEGRSVEFWSPLAYTARFDAAQTLVPDCCDWDVGVSEGASYATVWDLDRTCPPDRHQIAAASIAIALSIAALRARAH